MSGLDMKINVIHIKSIQGSSLLSSRLYTDILTQLIICLCVLKKNISLVGKQNCSCSIIYDRHLMERDKEREEN